jgi:hypothetical protein
MGFLCLRRVKKGVTIAHICLARRQIRINQGPGDYSRLYFWYASNAAARHFCQKNSAPHACQNVNGAPQHYALRVVLTEMKVLYCHQNRIDT